MPQALPPDPPAIVVTARALPDAAAERAHGVTVIDAGRLADSASGQLDQILKEVAGLQLFRRSDARSGHPTSQGVTFRALGGNASSRALLTLDGVPQADPFGGWVNWPAYDTAALGEVRIVRGGGSVTAGPGALAGVIAMTSAFADGVTGSLAAGSRGSAEARGTLGAELADGALGLSFRAERGDGFVPVTAATRGPADRAAPYRAASARALWSHDLGGNTEVQLAGSAFFDRRERGVEFTGNRTHGADASLRLVGRGGLGWSGQVYGQWRDLRSSFASVGAGRATATRASLQDSVPSTAFGGSAEVRPVLGSVDFRIGGDLRVTDGESRELFSYVAGQPTRRRIAGGRTLTAGAFAEATHGIGPLTLSAGARLDRWRVSDGRLLEYVIGTGASLRDETYADRSGWRPTARGGAVVDLGRGLSLHSAAYLGWRMPTLNELFRPFRVGPDATAANPILKPERLRGAEAGISYSRPSAKVDLVIVANLLEDPIANVTLAQGPGIFPGVGFVAAGGRYAQRQNLDSVRVHAIETNGELSRGPWTMFGSLSLADARVVARGVAAPLDGLRPAQTPRFAASLGAGWHDRGRTLSLTLRHVGNQFEDDLNQRRLRAATTLDAFAAWPLAERLDIVLRGENLFDETVIAGIAGDGSVERATPRTVWLGLRLSGRR